MRWRAAGCITLAGMSESFQFDAGNGSITVGVRGARITHCQVEGLDENLFYDDGRGGGGDRLWIAPEVAFYWPSLEEARRDPVGTAETPRDVDPGTYEVEGDWPGGVQLVNSCSLVDSRDDKAIGLEMKRTVAVTDRPHGLPDAVHCVSFALVNELLVTGGDPGAVAAAWDILQVPPTGTLVCPTTTRVQPRSYYDPFGDRHVRADGHAVRFLIDLQRRIKMGIRPEHTTGRMGYFREHPAGGSGSGWASLILRVFAVSPGESYVDIPRDHPADQRRGGDALQAYCDDQTFGRFGEMEYVAPAVVVGGCEYRHSACVTHVLAGPTDAVREAGGALLGVEI